MTAGRAGTNRASFSTPDRTKLAAEGQLGAFEMVSAFLFAEAGNYGDEDLNGEKKQPEVHASV